MAHRCVHVTMALGVAAAVLTALIATPGAPSLAAKTPDLALYHNGWDSVYRNPFGAIPTGSRVTLRLASSASVSRATLDLVAKDGTVKAYRMALQRRSSGRDLWAATVTAPGTPTTFGYHFQVQAGSTVRWYGDNNSVGDDGPGQTYTDGSQVLDYELTVYKNSFHAPNWTNSAVVYQIFPDRFYNGDKNNDPVNGTHFGYITVHYHTNWNDLPDQPPCGCDFFGGDLQGIIDKLPYLHSLGVNVLYLNPIFLAPSNHKYDTSNFLEIDPEFGTLQTSHTLVANMKKLGMHLILDGVFEDTGSDSVYFNKYGRFHDLGAYQSQKSPYYPWYTFQSWPNQYSDWSGVDTLPLLKESPAVENFIFGGKGSVAQYWLQQGASGWRLDSANSLSDAYWQAFRKAVKGADPNAVIIGEYWQNALPWLMGNEWDGVVNYEFREPVLDFFANGVGAQQPGKIDAANFLETEMGLLVEYPRPAITASMNIVDSHDVPRILTDLNGNIAALKLVALYQMTWPGAPTIYYGDEAGLQGATDPDDRRTFPWSHQNMSLETFYRNAIHMRLRYPALAGGSVTPLLASNAQRVVAFLRQQGAQQIVVILNDSKTSETVKIPVPQVASGKQLMNLLPGGIRASVKVQKGSLRVTIPALSGLVLG